MCITNVLRSKFKIPEQVTIIGCGPNGAEYAKDTTDFCITMNASVLLPPTPNVWICKDIHMLNMPWWNSAKEKADKTNPTIILSKHLSEAANFHHDFFYIRKDFGEINSNTSSAGPCIQLAAMLGAKEIKLCGLDMWGAKDFNCVMNRKDDAFVKSHLTPLNNLIQYLKNDYGIRFQTVSKTLLSI